MEKNPWPVFLTLIGLFAVGILWQSVKSPGVLILIIGGILLLYLAQKSHKNNFTNRIFLLMGGLALFFGLSTSWFFWVALIITVLFLGLESYHMIPSFRGGKLKQEKSLHIIHTVEPEEKGGKRYKRSWIANDRIGTKDVFEWDDINITKLGGDTFIDLGNTLLPKEDNVILIRKGFGQTKVFVPTGVSVMVEHSTLMGNVSFDGEKYSLRNESVRLYDSDYDFTQRRLKIISSSIVGDLEVVQL